MIPNTIRAGDTVKWTETHTALPGPEWKIIYTLHNSDAAASIDIESTPDGSTHSFELSASKTKDITSGPYAYQRRAVRGAGAELERYTLSTGTVIVEPDLTTVGGEDSRSFNRRMVDNLEKVLEKFSNTDAAQFTIGGRTYIRADFQKYVRMYNEFKQRLTDEERKEQGKPTQRLRLARFDKI